MSKNILNAVKSLFQDDEASYRSEFEEELSLRDRERSESGAYITPSVQDSWNEFRKAKEQEDMEGKVW